MSAYALPGLVFPPISNEYFSSSLDKNGNNYARSQDPIIGSTDINSTLRSSNISSAAEEKIGTRINAWDVTIKDDDDNVVDDVEVYVNGAQIDIMQFVNSRTCSESNNKSSRQPKTLKKRICTNPSRIDRRQRLTQRNKKSLSSTTSSSSSSDDNDSTKQLFSPCPRESSIQFAVTISYHDRTYEGIHSLSRIRQLHQELVENAIEEELFAVNNNSESDSSLGEPHPSLESQIPSEQRPYISRNKIPDLPKIFYENNATITNFMHLYAQIHQCYAPAIQSWFRKLLKVFTPSENSILAYFLCESIMLNSGVQDNNNKQQPQPKLSKRSPSFGSQLLDIIAEEGINTTEEVVIKVEDEKEDDVN